MSLQEFFYMDGYGFYVWGSYLTASIIFLGLFVSSKIQKDKLIRQLRKRYQHQADQAHQATQQSD